MAYFKKFLCSILICISFLSCTTGLGDRIDLEAPELTISKMISGESEPQTNFATTVYTKHDVTFLGKAVDNVKVTKVYAEVKWLGDEDYSFLQNAEINNEDWMLSIKFEKEGACWLKISAEDDRKNYGVKTSKVVTLFVDENAPIGNAWYIDRKINGIQYNLQSLEELKEIIRLDPELNQPANIDVAQNGEFIICSSFNDASGIKSTSINIWDENGHKINKSPVLSETGNSAYAPRFIINKEKADLPAGDGNPHYYEVRYNAADTVENPGSNTVEDALIMENDISMGWFIWWPEKDLPRCAVTNIENNKLNLHVGDSLNITIFDDDALSGNIECELVNGEKKTYRVTNNEREVNIVLTAPLEPQTMKLKISATDVNGNTLSRSDMEVQVTSDTVPNLILITPEANQIPTVTGSNAEINFSGIALDLVGSTYLEFVWVPDSIPNKNEKASKWLATIGAATNGHENYKPGSSQSVRVTEGSGEFDGMKLFSAKLTDAGTQLIFKKHEFNFNLSLLNSFGNDKKKDKYFFARLTRKDGNYSETEFVLPADTLKPEIVPVNPGGNMAIIDMDTDLDIQFYAKKDNGLAMDNSKYKVYYSGEQTPLTGFYDETAKVYKVKIPASKLHLFNENRESPKYKFYAVDLLGNDVETEYQFIISKLPAIKTVSSSSPDNCKKGDSILINVSFTKSVVCNENTKLKLKNITNEINGTGADDVVYASYKSGSGSTTLVFEYVVQDGDTSSELHVFNEEGIGPIAGISSGVHLDKLLEANNLQSNRNILNKNALSIDGISPVVTSLKIETDAELKNKIDGIAYLRAGKTITATVVTDEPVTIQGSPKIELQSSDGSLYLDWQSISEDGRTLKFSKKIDKNDVNGHLYYSSESYISENNVITDSYGNSLSVSKARSSVDSKIVVDTKVPATPKISSTQSSDNDSTGTLKSGKYKTILYFNVSTNAPEITEYSTDAGRTWNVYSKTEKLENDASLIARRTDYAGNVSDYSKQIDIEITNSFPMFSIECTNVDGKYNYKSKNELKFKVYFARPVDISATSDAYISIGGLADDIVTNGAKAVIDTASKGKTGVTEASFTYKIQATDQFTLKIAENGVNLYGIVDQFGFSQGDKILSSPYLRNNIRCDSINPSIISMCPDGIEKTLSSGKKSYDNGKKIVLRFSEPVKVSSGKIYLRQTSGWAIPPMFTGTEFTTVLNAVKKAGISNIGASKLTGSQILYLDGLEDSEWLFGSEVGVPNDIYHGTGQYTGPYKKTSHGIYDNGKPDLAVKYVLDYDVDIWNSADSKKTKFGKTFETGNESRHSTTSNQSRTGMIVVNEGSNIITTDDIRNVLEQIHFHERYMNVNSSSVIVSEDGKTVTLNFPAGLLGDVDLPAGREWELVIEKGAFMDESGNYFGADQNGILDKSNEAFVLVNNGENSSFLSAGVAKPVIRVDRYSYNIGIYQPYMDEGSIVTQMINTIGLGEKATTEPTGKVRIKIDCETKDAVIRYTKSEASKDNDDVSEDSMYYHNGANSFYSTTELSLPSDPDSESTKQKQKIEFLGGNGSYTSSCKQYYKADAVYENEKSLIEKEGVFQTTLNINDPKRPNGNSIADFLNGYKDVSIRGTTGFAGEPSISPFPLRDSQVGSPFLKRTYQVEDKQYYWISYEILVESSFSMYAWCQNWSVKRNCYNWGRNWGVMEPGEFTRVDGFKHWEN